MWTRATITKIVRNVALQVVVDSNSERRHVVALVNQENTTENSNFEIRGEIPLPYRINAKTEESESGLSNRRQYAG